MFENNATRLALIDALLNPRGPDLPGRDVKYGNEISPMMTGPQPDADALEQRRGYALPIPSRSPRTFSEDYRPSEWDHERRTATDAEGRLLRDMEGRRLRAEYVVGRRHRDGRDVGLQPHEVIDVTTKLLGASPRFLSEDQLRERWPRTANPPVGETLRNFPGWPSSVNLDARLDPSARHITAGHELGHVIGLTRDFVTNDIEDELRSLYNTINNRRRTPDGSDAASGSPAVTPETFGYRDPYYARHEYIAEAIRAYMTDPNFVKTAAPNVAAAIRRAVNTNPRLNRTIQFNSLEFPRHAGLEASSDQAGTDLG